MEEKLGEKMKLIYFATRCRSGCRYIHKFDLEDEIISKIGNKYIGYSTESIIIKYFELCGHEFLNYFSKIT